MKAMSNIDIQPGTVIRSLQCLTGIAALKLSSFFPIKAVLLKSKKSLPAYG